MSGIRLPFRRSKMGSAPPPPAPSGNDEVPLAHAEEPNINTVEDPTNKDDAFDHNSFATKKTTSLGLLDVCLLADNAYQLRTLFILWNFNGFQIAQLVFVIISVLLQVILGIMLLYLGKYNVNNPTECSKANRQQNAVTLMLYFILLINLFISSFHMVDSTPTVGPAPENFGNSITK